MPRFKRLQKKQNSEPSPTFQPASQPSPIFQPTSHPSQSVHLTSHPAPMDQAASQPSRSVHSTPTDQDSSQQGPTVQDSSQRGPTVQDSSQRGPTVQASSRKRSGNHWTVDAIAENIKKLKVKVNEVLYLTREERIVVDFDYLDEPFGDARALLSGFCGILACDCALFPIHCEKWSSLPISYFNRAFDQIIKEPHSLSGLSSQEPHSLSGLSSHQVNILVDNLDVENVDTVNLKAATSAALLLLPSKFTEEDLYAKICSLSYMGDLRMLFAEDKNKGGSRQVRFQVLQEML